MNRVFIGFDTRLATAYMVAHKSLMDNCQDKSNLRVDPLLLPELYGKGIYKRETQKQGNQLYDAISDAPMSTEFAISRFFAPYLSGYKGWSIFFDSDFLLVADINEAFALADPSKAVQVVKHNYNPDSGFKMDGQRQTKYNRKNWSSFILFNNAHPSNALLNIEQLNTMPGKYFHQFGWLADNEIGELPMGWNFLDGHTTLDDVCYDDIKCVHYTHGTPDMPGHENAVLAGLWENYAGETKICLSAS